MHARQRARGLRELGMHLGQPFQCAVMFGDHHDIGPLRKQLPVLAEGLAHQALDPIPPHGVPDLARYRDPEPRPSVFGRRDQQQKACGVDAPAPIPGKPELKPLAQTIGAGKST
jgi:hypothetical protein